MTKVKTAGIVLSGLVAGFMSGLLGVGGGVVMVPLLVFIASFTQHGAHATSLAAVIAIGAVGATTFAVDGEIDLGIAVFLAVGSLFGAPLGARLMHRIPEVSLKIAFGVLMILVAGLLVWS